MWQSIVTAIATTITSLLSKGKNSDFAHRRRIQILTERLEREKAAYEKKLLDALDKKTKSS